MEYVKGSVGLVAEGHKKSDVEQIEAFAARSALDEHTARVGKDLAGE